MPQVELIYSRGCPHVAAARAQLLRAFAAAGTPPRWQEWQRGEPDSPPHVEGYGSPTILIDGRDVDGAGPGGADACRFYPGPDGSLRGVPAVEKIAAALRAVPVRRDHAAGVRIPLEHLAEERRRCGPVPGLPRRPKG